MTNGVRKNATATPAPKRTTWSAEPEAMSFAADRDIDFRGLFSAAESSAKML